MGNFEDMVLGLQQDMEVPADVWEKYTDTLSNLPDMEEKQNVKNRCWLKYVASAAAMAIVVTAACSANPALAAKIPFIGRIFAEVQQISEFSGEYDGKAEILNTETSDAEEVSNQEYVTEDAGVKITASEIYCDGLSVFLTAEVDVEQGKLKNIPGASKTMYLQGSWKTGADGQEKELENDNMKGKVVDDHTFIGMLKLDLDEGAKQDDTVELKLSMVGYDDIYEQDEEDISASHKIEGEWALALPYTVDTEAVKRIPVNKENQGYCLKEVFVSPYQVVAYADIPYTERTTTREEFEEMMKIKTGGAGDPDYTYEEYMEQKGKIYANCCTVIFNQDGEQLQSRGEYRGNSVSAVQGKEITKLYIYLFDDGDACQEMEEEGMGSAAADKALVFAEVDVK